MTDHNQRFSSAVARYQTHARHEVPADWLSALYLLTADEKVWRVVQPHIDFRARLADLRRPDYGVLSSGEKVIIRLAANLFYGEGLVDMHDVCYILDEALFEAVVDALWIRRRGWEGLEAVRRSKVDPIPF